MTLYWIHPKRSRIHSESTKNLSPSPKRINHPLIETYRNHGFRREVPHHWDHFYGGLHIGVMGIPRPHHRWPARANPRRSERWCVHACSWIGKCWGIFFKPWELDFWYFCWVVNVMNIYEWHDSHGICCWVVHVDDVVNDVIIMISTWELDGILHKHLQTSCTSEGIMMQNLRWFKLQGW